MSAQLLDIGYRDNALHRRRGDACSAVIVFENRVGMLLLSISGSLAT